MSGAVKRINSNWKSNLGGGSNQFGLVPQHSSRPSNSQFDKYSSKNSAGRQSTRSSIFQTSSKRLKFGKQNNQGNLEEDPYKMSKE